MNLADYFEQKHGSQAQLSRDTGIHAPTLSAWASGARPVPLERCPQIERATDGAVSCEELNDSARWMRIPDPDWPWHPEGKPLIDPMPEQAQEPVAAGQGA